MDVPFENGLNNPKAISNTQLLQFDQLPSEILNNIIYWLSNGQISLDSNSSRFPEHTYIINRERCGDCYQNLLSLSSVNSNLRQYLSGVLFQNISIIRKNQIDSLLCSPKTQELFSDKMTYHREFFSELINKNIESCNNSELAKSGFKNHYIGDHRFKSRYQEVLCLCNYVKYLECDNSMLSNEDLKMFPSLNELKILDEAIVTTIPLQFNLPKLSYLAVHIQTLQLTPMLLHTLPSLKRLDLFVCYGDIPTKQGLDVLIDFINSNQIELEEFVLFLDNAFTIAYTETIRLLESIVTLNLKKLTIRVNRRKLSPTHYDNDHALFPGYAGDELLKVFSQPIDILLDVSILEFIKFHPDTINNSEYFDSTISKTLTIVDRTVTGPQMSFNLRETLGVIVRLSGINQLSFQYGETLEESHLHVLKIVTDFVQWMVNPILNKNVGYFGLHKILIEKCWSYSDDSIIREYLMDMIDKEKYKYKINASTIWTKTAFNSPRYRIKDSYDISYGKSSGYSVMDNNGYFVGTSQQSIDKANFITSNDKKDQRLKGDYFWSIEASLCDFEQYCTHQRKTLLSP
ncbi:hypothetical protein KGF54_003691 [Candida jiufengensis]|uniref:uncharacterized protein n=1 Tax=Candida jiufengensis TaxID=497108 RepID=UPI00222458F5|nr:uncharacterized protein KGF54_003691 [Candida jiufengensis]KAI5952824.1 hypothetical protein KGF54_003691 [Candida jiufengensis]